MTPAQAAKTLRGMIRRGGRWAFEVEALRLAIAALTHKRKRRTKR